MNELGCLLLGAMVAFGATWLWRHRRDRAARAAAVAAAAAAVRPAVTPTADPHPPQALAARRLVLSLADQLANLVSGVEHRTHALIEAAPDLTQLPAAAEALVGAVQRLRTMHAKMLAFGRARGRSGEAKTVQLPDLVVRLRDELQRLQLGLELRWDPPPHAAEVAAPPEIVHDALSFLCTAMLRAERGATRLSIAAERCFATTPPRLQLELVLEWSSEASPRSSELLDDPTFAVDLEASNHLITSHGGELAIHHLAGRSVRAVVRWPLAPPPVLLPEPPPVPVVAEPPCPQAPDVPHDYGGALLLEADPAVRAMLARELKAAGRAVFACADGASARSFLEATPDRFELLIVDDPRRLEEDDPLAATIRERTPALKIFALSQAPALQPGWPHLHHIEKPFGVHELRRALAAVLTAG